MLLPCLPFSVTRSEMAWLIGRDQSWHICANFPVHLSSVDFLLHGLLRPADRLGIGAYALAVLAALFRWPQPLRCGVDLGEMAWLVGRSSYSIWNNCSVHLSSVGFPLHGWLRPANRLGIGAYALPERSPWSVRWSTA
jgi:hypothetical protein